MYSDIPITHYCTHDCAGAMYMHVCTECWSVPQEWQDVLDGLSSDMVVHESNGCGQETTI